MTQILSLLARLFTSREPVTDADCTVHLAPTGRFDQAIVGESHYQDNLERICGPRKEEGENLVTDAVLTLEDDNPHDPKAVCVSIGGLTVGYLSRADARTFRSKRAPDPNAAKKAVCKAKIRGGWQRGPSDGGHYGVWLDS